MATTSRRKSKPKRLTIKQFLAEYPVCSDRTLRRWINAGRIEAFQPAGPGGKILIPRNALKRLKPKAASVSEPHTESSADGHRTSTPQWERDVLGD